MSDFKGCYRCVHFYFNGSCAAFYPKPIPLPIVAGEPHDKPMFGQSNEIVFELRDPKIDVSELIRNAQALPSPVIA